MNKRALVIVVAVGLVALIAAAFAYDCVRLVGQARARVVLADQELVKHEQRLVKLLAGSPGTSPELEQAIAAYQEAAARGPSNFPARHGAYDALVAALQKTMLESQFDATNPLQRKFMDDVAGAINRRQMAEPPYDAEMAAYLASRGGVRGAVARILSPQDGSH